MSERYDAIVIGAGLAGLSAAIRIKRSGGRVLVLEKSSRAGGVLKTVSESGFLLEMGANSTQATPDLLRFIDELGLTNEIVRAHHDLPRFVYGNGKLRRVPLSPLQFLTTDALSFTGKWNLVAHLLKKVPPPPNESVMAFAERKLGSEAAEKLAAPFVSGVWAGDATQLEAASAFASFGKKGARGLVAFKSGMEALPRAMAERLSGSIRFNETVESIEPMSGGWQVRTGTDDFAAEKLYLSAPAWELAPLVESISPNAAAALAAIPSVALAVVHLGFKKKNVRNQTAGFGFLNWPGERPDILGCIWSSRLFPGRAPKDVDLFTVFMGGATNPAMLKNSDDVLKEKAAAALQFPMKLTGTPTFAHLTRIAKAIPQYTVGHSERMRVLEKTEKEFEGLFFAGNYKGGIAVGDVISKTL